MDFDVVPFDDITWGKRLGAGSFGSVFKGNYLGIDIAIKEILPSTEYDVHKYFEREWRIMRECRHPNIVLFLGLSKAPAGDGRVFIISEFVPRGNLRQYILSSRPFPWRLRLSFATDVARAVAYLHARSCIHRDLKGENLLITSNDRVKVTDFGFARIASRNAEEMKRMTYCGTDGYMSPEIINGFEIDLPTDIVSLGIIFVEIFCRRLVDSKTFIRLPPAFTLDEAEVRRRASPGCPPALIDLALECCREEPSARPRMPEILSRLRAIEKEVCARLTDDMEHVGSIKVLQHGGKRAMPIFEPADKDAEALQRELAAANRTVRHSRDEGGASETEGGWEAEREEEKTVQQLEQDALDALAGLKIEVDGRGAAALEITMNDGKQTWRTARWNERSTVLGATAFSSAFTSHVPDDTATSPVAAITTGGTAQDHGDMASTITVRASPPDTPIAPTEATLAADTSPGAPITQSRFDAMQQDKDRPPVTHQDAPGEGNSKATVEEKKEEPAPRRGLQTKAERADELAAKTAPPIASGTHRFTLIDKEALQVMAGKRPSHYPSAFAAFLPKALAPANKCPVCHKRLGNRPALQCDDCEIIVHVGCSHATARDCTGGDGRAHLTPP